MNEKLVQITINGKKITAPTSLSAIQAVWHAGYTKVDGVGCLEGVCGSCRVMVRKSGKSEVTTQLGCQTFIEEGMQIIFLGFPPPTHHTYQLDDIKNSWDLQAQFHQIFPEVKHCRSCNGCTRSCPKEIDVKYGIELANKGKFKDMGDLFVECVMCNLCMTACPENIAPNHVALFCRRVNAYFHIRPANLINRLEDLRKGKMEIVT
jgi:succinate dehydrogenase/fumarate reductase-like Fe-S protein